MRRKQPSQAWKECRHENRPKSKAFKKSSRQDEFLICLLYAWQVGKAPAAREAIRRYCEYICFHGCPGFASNVIDALEGMDKWSAEAWIRQTHAQYVQDNRAMLRYIFGI